MLLVLFLLFTLLPVTEFAILLQLGARIGLFGTIALVLFTGVLGASLARWQGMQTLWRLRTGMSRGEPPTDVLLDGAMILVAAAVLVTPGVLTDLFGFALLTPPIRAIIKPMLRAWFAKKVKVQVNPGMFSQSSRYDNGDVVEGEIVQEGEIIDIKSETKETKL